MKSNSEKFFEYLLLLNQGLLRWLIIISFIALHVFVVVVAWDAGGFFKLAATIFLPVLSEIYWFVIDYMKTDGVNTNFQYLCLFCASMYILSRGISLVQAIMLTKMLGNMGNDDL